MQVEKKNQIMPAFCRQDGTYAKSGLGWTNLRCDSWEIQTQAIGGREQLWSNVLLRIMDQSPTASHQQIEPEKNESIDARTSLA